MTSEAEAARAARASEFEKPVRTLDMQGLLGGAASPPLKDVLRQRGGSVGRPGGRAAGSGTSRGDPSPARGRPVVSDFRFPKPNAAERGKSPASLGQVANFMANALGSVVGRPLGGESSGQRGASAGAMRARASQSSSSSSGAQRSNSSTGRMNPDRVKAIHARGFHPDLRVPATKGSLVRAPVPPSPVDPAASAALSADAAPLSEALAASEASPQAAATPPEASAEAPAPAAEEPERTAGEPTEAPAEEGECQRSPSAEEEQTRPQEAQASQPAAEEAPAASSPVTNPVEEEQPAEPATEEAPAACQPVSPEESSHRSEPEAAPQAELAKPHLLNGRNDWVRKDGGNGASTPRTKSWIKKDFTPEAEGAGSDGKNRRSETPARLRTLQEFWGGGKESVGYATGADKGKLSKQEVEAALLRLQGANQTTDLDEVRKLRKQLSQFDS